MLWARSHSTVLLTIGEAGERIADAVARRSGSVLQISAATMRAAVTAARHAMRAGGVILLSPAAPSFDQYRNWEERSDDFISIVHELVGK